ncbi:type I restriction endonuclease subunit R [Brassicibacter mesophilus]|uniref:type I restriction endonuclease subunit R n=1 Tax=Brassicibacter mesophilus TaxID=745119 RepID=UPI003D1B178C
MPNGEIYLEDNITKIPAVEILNKLGYISIASNEALTMRGNKIDVILKDILKEQIKSINSYEYKGKKFQFSDRNIEQAIKDINESLTDGLITTNEKIYDKLMLGNSYEEVLLEDDGHTTRRSFDISYINWTEWDKNVFHIVEEFEVERANGKLARPDLVLFVNGIPFAIIECKSPTVTVDEAVSQMIRNQGKEWIPDLFKFAQIVIATNKNEVKYASCGTPSKFWSVWKEEDEEWLQRNLNKAVNNRMPTEQDKILISLLEPKRLLDLTKNFIVFDKNIKKIARYQQFFAVKEIIKKIKTYNEEGNRKGGVIWHTQGSGKSITMVMLSKHIFSDQDIIDPKVIVITDRKSLDKQITNTFEHTKLKPNRAKTGNELVSLVKNNSADVITSLIHKFKTATKKDIQVMSKNIFILVDESHRSNYGLLHNEMKDVFPNACYLGFTGTPLMKKDKVTTVQKFGDYIHKYTIVDGVEDGAIVPLLYEGRMVEQSVNQKAIDNKLEMITRDLTDKQKEEVKKKWSRFEKIASSNQRIDLVAFDINDHYTKHYKGTSFKGMLATNSRAEAIKYHKAFKELGDLKTAVVISPPDMREDHEVLDQESKNIIKKFWNEMMEIYKNEDKYEEDIKDSFIDGDLDIIIVASKLLTGFDAPRATVLYVDKEMKDHTLLQAIARVNRLYEGKDYGIIIDYRGLLKRLDEAMDIYSGAGLDDFDPNDIKGAVHDVISTIGFLRHHYTQLVNIFLPIRNKEEVEQYEILLADEELREDFYYELGQYGKFLNIAIESENIYKALGKEEIEKYKKELKFYQKLRKSVKLRYSDDVDNKEYEAKMQKLMDNYISAEEVIQITKPVDILDDEGMEEELNWLETPRAKADAIRSRLTKSISEKFDENPAFYKKFSERVNETIQAYKDKRISEAEYLQRMWDIRQDYKKGYSGDEYPKNIQKNRSAQAFYGISKDIIGRTNDLADKDGLMGDLALKIDEIIKEYRKVDWHDNIEVHKQIEQEVDDLLFDFAYQVGLELSIEQIDEIIETVKTIALRRY